VTRLLAALGAGSLVAASLPPWGWWPLAFVGVAVFELVLAGATTRAQRWRLGTAFGLGWLAPGMGWMWFLTPPGYAIASVGFAALHGVAAMATTGSRGRLLVRPAAHTLVEALRFAAPFGGVPLASLAIAQAAGPLAVLGRLGGPILLTWATLAIGVAGAGIARHRAHWREPAVAVAVVVALAGVAWLVPFTRSTGDTLRVAAVQGGGPQGTLAIDTDPRDVVQRHLEATASLGREQSVELVVWPENVIATGDTPFADSDVRRAVAAEAARLGVPFAVGITERPRPWRFTNAQVVVQPDGSLTDRYDKVRRVPFGEYMPLRGLLDAVGAPVDRVPTDAIAGVGPAYLDVADRRLAVVISWEVFFGGRARDGVGRGGALVLNPTNGSSYTGTILQTQQIASSRLRAIETGRWVVQVAPTGFSAFISPSGEVLDRTGISTRAVLVADLPLREGRTPYGVGGDVPVVAAALAALLSGVWLTRRTTAPRSSR